LLRGAGFNWLLGSLSAERGTMDKPNDHHGHGKSTRQRQKAKTNNSGRTNSNN